MEKLFTTKPYLPDLKEFLPYLERIWESRVLTNGGELHQELEKQLCSFLGVKYISLFSSGMSALLAAIKVSELSGQVITTPFSFVATAHAIKLLGLEPVFADVDPKTGNLDPNKIERLLSKSTSAILPVHVFGQPCDHDSLEAVAEESGVTLLYDAAHAFGVKQNGCSVLNMGALSVLSFHATKVFNTFEGGAVVAHSPEVKCQLDRMRNFGIENEVKVPGLGFNGKMSEVHAAMGLLQLKHFSTVLEKRKRVTERYEERLKGFSYIQLPSRPLNIEHNYGYFPLYLKEKQGPFSRDRVLSRLRKAGVYGRRYFYPLISEQNDYLSCPSSSTSGLPVAYEMSQSVLCLPIYPDLSLEDQERVINKLLLEV